MNITSLALAKKFTEQSLNGVGALKGAPCQVKSINEGLDESGRRFVEITLSWEDKNGQIFEESFTIKDGLDGLDGISSNNTSVIPNWLQDDAQAADFIKNKPITITEKTLFEDTITIEYILESNVNMYIGFLNFVFPNQSNLSIEDSAYVIYFHGKRYDCLPKSFDDMNLYGNLKIFLEVLLKDELHEDYSPQILEDYLLALNIEDSGEPFALYVGDSKSIIYLSEEFSTDTIHRPIKIVKQTQKILPNCLPSARDNGFGAVSLDDLLPPYTERDEGKFLGIYGGKLKWLNIVE